MYDDDDDDFMTVILLTIIAKTDLSENHVESRLMRYQSRSIL
jgi:hypothetical protein